MQLAWYRKYRPRTFAEVVGQEHVKITLGNQAKSGSLGHAYLFSGPKGTGKTSMARILARTANCVQLNSGEACGKCVQCQTFDAGQMLDLIEIDAASHTGVDNIRDIIDKVALAPSQGRFKVYVIDEAHMLSKAAFNALLKTLEEPPAHVMFVLATTEPHKLPTTIISRCQRFDFRYLSATNIIKWLKSVAEKEQVKLDDGAAMLIARESGGSMRDALSLLEQAAMVGEEINREQLINWLGLVDASLIYQLMEMILGGQSKEAVGLVNQMHRDGYDLGQLVTAWILTMRQILAIKLDNLMAIDLSADQIDNLKKMSDQLSLEQIAWLMESLMATMQEIKLAAVAQLPLELLIVRSVGRLASQPVDSASPTDNQPPASGVGGTTETPVGMPVDADKDWPEVVRLVRQTHPTLSAVLGQTGAVIHEGKLRLICRSAFHKETIEQAVNRQVIVNVLERLGKQVKLECTVDTAKRNDTVAVEDVVQVFGQT